MDAILRALRRAGDPIHNPTTSKLLLMDWQARYIWVKCRIEKIRGDPSSDTVPASSKTTTSTPESTQSCTISSAT